MHTDYVIYIYTHIRKKGHYTYTQTTYVYFVVGRSIYFIYIQILGELKLFERYINFFSKKIFIFPLRTSCNGTFYMEKILE